MKATGDVVKARFGNPYQWIAGILCLTLSLLMVLNTQMGGEGMWFWYAYAFRNGAKLYSDMHVALQPLFVIEMATWTRLFGTKLIVYEIPSVLHALLLALGIYLILRESNLRDWQKAIMLFGCFVFVVVIPSYRLDDYHVVAETLVVYATWVLLSIGRMLQEQNAKILAKVALLGAICGATIEIRVTDGVALVFSCTLCLLFLLKRERIRTTLLFYVSIAATIGLVLWVVNDSVSAYLSSTIFKAAASKGGGSSIALMPFQMIWRSEELVRHAKKKIAGLLLMFLVGAWMERRVSVRREWIFPAQLGVALLCIKLFDVRWKIGSEISFFEFIALASTLGMYVLASIAIIRWVRALRRKEGWDAREILILIPIFHWASYAAVSSAEPLFNYYASSALALLLIPVLKPFKRHAGLVDAWLLCVMLLLTLNGVITKVRTPYSWQNYHFPAMFMNRVWYNHPVYGPMYIDKENLSFIRKVCNDIQAKPIAMKGDLLSLPYPFPNYFCSIPPWHNYVQTFFDTSTRATIDHLVDELKASPPEWIVYQRQINIMVGAERLYNHGAPLPQRDLDALIMTNIATGKWTLVDESSYLQPWYWGHPKDTDWYIIHTIPASSGAHPASL